MLSKKLFFLFLFLFLPYWHLLWLFHSRIGVEFEQPRRCGALQIPLLNVLQVVNVLGYLQPTQER